MKQKIVATDLAAWDRAYLVPLGTSERQLVTVTGSREYTGHLTVYGMITGTDPGVPVVVHVPPLMLIEVEA